MISEFTGRKRTIARAVFLGLAISHATTKAFAQTGAPAPQAMQHEYTIRNFTTESAAVLPEAHIVYGTYGTLDAAGDNAVLLPPTTWRTCTAMSG
jgi:homoserine O-acetyltransferase